MRAPVVDKEPDGSGVRRGRGTSHSVSFEGVGRGGAGAGAGLGSGRVPGREYSSTVAQLAGFNEKSPVLVCYREDLRVVSTAAWRSGVEWRIAERAPAKFKQPSRVGCILSLAYCCANKAPNRSENMATENKIEFERS